MPRRAVVRIVFVFGAAGCAGAIGAGDRAPATDDPAAGRSGASMAGAGSNAAIPSGAGSCQPAPVPLHRLTASEFDATVYDLLGDDTHPARAWPAAASSTGFDNSSGDQGFADVVIKAIAESAADVAARASQRLAGPTSILPCDPAKAGEAACASTFIERFGRRAFRRPLRDEDRARLQGSFAAGKAAGGFALGVAAAIESALQSPHFLYRVEGAASSDPTLTPHELAARLSYFLTGSTPDDALAAAADAGTITNDAVLAQHARRLLAGPRGRAMIRDFHRQWLQLDRAIGVTRDAKLFPAFTDRTPGALVEGAQAFAAWVMGDSPDGTFRELLTSNVAFGNADAAWVLGATASGTALVKLTLPPAERAGVVTLPAILGGLGGKPATSAPVLRGKFVREQLLCQGVPPPPANLDVRVPEPQAGQTTRQRFAAHSTSEVCAGCHRLLDGVGFGFEAYDAVGAHRTSEQGQPIDQSGSLVATDAIDGPFDGAVDLAGKLAGSREARACLARMWLRFALTRLDAATDECLIADLTDRLGREGFKLAELPVVIASSAAFRSHAPIAATPSCQP